MAGASKGKGGRGGKEEPPLLQLRGCHDRDAQHYNQWCVNFIMAQLIFTYQAHTYAWNTKLASKIFDDVG